MAQSTNRLTIAYQYAKRYPLGQIRFNILILGIVHDGVAYPVVWEMLEKKGNSDSEERMDLLDRFDKIFPDAQVAYLCGDREFVGKQWLTYLLKLPTISFRLRIRHSDKISDGQKQQGSFDCLCQSPTGVRLKFYLVVDGFGVVRFMLLVYV